MWEITPEKSASGYECTRSCWYGLSGMSLDENRVSRSVDGLAIYHQMSLAPRSTTEPTAPQPRASSRIQAHLSGPAGVRLVNRLICDRAGWQAGADSDYVRYGLLIGIGAAVTRRPLPHHRAYGSVHGGSSWLR